MLGWDDFQAELVYEIWPETTKISPDDLAQLAKDSKYEPYLKRQQSEVDSLRRDESLQIPADLDFASIVGLSNELVLKLGKVRPGTLGQAGRIEGMTPAALALVLAACRNHPGSKNSTGPVSEHQCPSVAMFHVKHGLVFKPTKAWSENGTNG